MKESTEVLLCRLRAAARPHPLVSAPDVVYRKLARGGLGPTDSAQLEQREDPRARHMWQACRPLPAELQASMRAEAIGAMRPAAATPDRHFRVSRSRAVAGLALAIGAVAVVSWWPDPTRAPSGTALPSYALEISGGNKRWRDPIGEPAGEGTTLTLSATTRFALVLRPDQPVSAPAAAQVSAQLYWQTGGSPRPVPLGLQISAEGVMKWEGRGFAGWGTSGERGQLVLLVRTAQARGAGAAGLVTSPGQAGPGWRRWVVDVQLE